MPSLPPAVLRPVDAVLEASIVLSFSRIGYAVRSRLERWPDPATLPGTGRRVLVTGANSGLGYATSRALLAAGAEVRMLVRSGDKGDDTVRRLGEELGRDVSGAMSYGVADLTDLASIRAFADAELALDDRLDAVVHNAGAMFGRREITVDGMERTYQVHVVAPFLLTSGLLPKLRASSPTAAPGRVVTVTSGGMYTQRLDVAMLESPGHYRPSVAYGRAKRAQVVLNREWARRLIGQGVDVHVMHPGWVATPGIEASLPRFGQLTGPILRDPEQGADTIVWLVLEAARPQPGQLWLDRRPRSEHRVPWTRSDRSETLKLWERVCRDAGVSPDL